MKGYTNKGSFIKGHTFTGEILEKMRQGRLGKKHSLEARIKMSKSHLGSLAPAWKGGITEANQQIRHLFEYKEWRRKIFERDNYTCQICGERGGDIRSNHIKTFANYPELRMYLNNGIVICTNCEYLFVYRHEPEWESYFNFNLMTRGVLQ